MNIQEQLEETLELINKELARPNSDEEYAMLLVAKTNVLIGLQKYE